MDISDISKVASRKRMNVDAEKLREKVSRETAKIIKLKVAQDTAYWDLKEKLAQTERNRERLQQNMLDVQMQLEAASAESQRELRMRPDTLNKVTGARGMCDVLEAYAARLRAGVARSRADQAALAAAYGGAARRVRDQAAGAARARLRARLDARNHADAQRAAGEQVRASEERAAAAAREAGEARKAAAEASAARADLAARLEACALRLQRRDEAATALQEDARRLVREFEARSERMQAAITARDQQLKEASEANSGLRSALERQEQATQGERAQSERLQERAALAEERAATALRDLEDNKITIDRLNEKLEMLSENKQALEQAVSDKHQQAENMMEEAKTMKEQLERSEVARRELEEELERTKLESEAKIADAEASFQRQHSVDSLRVEELSRAAEGLESALALEREQRARADTAAAELRRRAAEEQDASVARISALEAQRAAKEAELVAQMDIILELRDEKERLQERIRGMRSTIDNIHKELTGREVGPPREAGERPHEAAPAPAPDTMLYNFLSDGSVDDDAFDTAEVNQRFEALSRAHAPHAPRAAQAQKPISLSQARVDMKMKNRVFFKNKRLDGKLKKNN